MPTPKVADLTCRATRLLSRWAEAIDPYWHEADDDPRLGCYGPGYIHWGVQSNWNYTAALATLAAQPGAAGADRWRARALGSFRFALATHVTGSRNGNDGRRWGHSWISPLGIERAMHGVARLVPWLQPEDRDGLRRVLTSEARWQLHSAERGAHKGLVAGLWNSSGRNAPESNIWIGSILWRAATLWPNEPEAEAWREAAHCYLVNGVSIEADAADATRLAGRPICERHVGANFFPNYALDHHGYMNVGYMTICVSNAAILHFDMKHAGLPRPESLDHHEADLWRVLRRMIFADGRLARIGGDSRVRYAYCQEYLLPALLYAADRLGDGHALDLAEGQLALIEREAEAGDGTFYGRRLDWLRRCNPHYYTRIESDRACVLAMLINHLPLVEAPAAPSASREESVAGGWIETAHGAAMHRGPRRFASFAWRAYGLSQALCLPPDRSDLAEWTLNLCPVVRFAGDDGTHSGRHRRLLAHVVRPFAGGFAACGSVMEGVGIALDEGASCTDQAVTHLAFVALPDERTCVGIQLVIAASDRVGWLVELKGLHLNVPNDMYNGSIRRIVSAGGERVLESPPASDEVIEAGGAWVNVDDVVGVSLLSGGDGLWIDRSSERRGGRYRTLFVDEICSCVERGPRRIRPGEVLIDCAFAVVSGTSAAETAAVEGGPMEGLPGLARGIWVRGADGRRYAVRAVFGDPPEVMVEW